MANQRDQHLEEILDRVKTHSQLILNAANELFLTPEHDDVWFPSLVQPFGDEATMFTKIEIDWFVLVKEFVHSYVNNLNSPLSNEGS